MDNELQNHVTAVKIIVESGALTIDDLKESVSELFLNGCIDLTYASMSLIYIQEAERQLNGVYDN
jgi:hypothetical protein